MLSVRWQVNRVLTSPSSYNTSSCFVWREKSRLPKFPGQLDPCFTNRKPQCQKHSRLKDNCRQQRTADSNTLFGCGGVPNLNNKIYIYRHAAVTSPQYIVMHLSCLPNHGTRLPNFPTSPYFSGLASCLRKYLFYISMVNLNYWCFITILWKFQKNWTSGTCWKSAFK